MAAGGQHGRACASGGRLLGFTGDDGGYLKNCSRFTAESAIAERIERGRTALRGSAGQAGLAHDPHPGLGVY
jgi:hypothetical protein